MARTTVALGVAVSTVAATLAISAFPPQSQAHSASALSQPTHSYQDAIRETVYVEAPVDGDHDGRHDKIVADIIRPRETATDLKVPVILEASPYYAPELVAQSRSTGPRHRATPSAGYKDADDDGVPTSFPGWYDNYFVPRGYAMVQVDLPGTRYSEGCPDLDGPEGVAAVKAVLDWLDGRAKATSKSGAEVQASWDTGKVGMVGKSRPGVVANILATQEVPNLKTIVPISSFASWYPYLRTNGLARFGDYPRWSSRTDGNTSKLGSHRCDATYDAIAAATDEADATYTSWFADRDFVARGASRLRASVFMVHGLNDFNVTTDLAAQWWKAVSQAGVPRKLLLTQVSHVDPFRSNRDYWVSQVHRWLDQWLLGVPSGIMNEPQVQIERTPGQFTGASAWPAVGAVPKQFFFERQRLLTTPPSADPGHSLFFERHEQRERDIVASPTEVRSHRLSFLGDALSRPTRLSGTAEITVTAKASASGTPLSAFLVDYGTSTRPRTDEDTGSMGVVATTTEDCIGQGAGVDTGCFTRYAHDLVTSDVKIVAKTSIDTENRNTLLLDTPVVPDKYYTYRLALQPNDHVFPAGHRIGVVIAGTNCTSMEVPGTDWCQHQPAAGDEPWPATEFEIDLSKSSAILPIAAE